MVVVSFGGFYATGGSALRDLLRDDSDVAVFPQEFRIIKEHRGLIDLYSHLRDSKVLENRDLALRDFVWLARKLQKSGRIRFLQRPGHRYEYLTAGHFSVATQNFVNALCSYEYPMNWHFYDFEKTNLQFWLGVARGVLSGKRAVQSAYSVSYDQAKVRKAFQVYLEEIFAAARLFLRADSGAPLALHNAVNPTSVSEIGMVRALVPDMKVIIMDRDPRDNFLDLPSGRYLPRGSQMEKAIAFVDLHRELRKELSSIRQLPGVLYVRFEDLVTKPSSTRAIVRDFLNLEPVPKDSAFGPHFNPKQSKTNVGIWHRVRGADTIEAVSYIERSLLRKS